jgi:hypothetical protein
VERQELLRARIMNLKEELENAGFGALLAPPPAIKTMADPVPDPKTKGLIAHVEEPLGTYIQRVPSGLKESAFFWLKQTTLTQPAH